MQEVRGNPRSDGRPPMADHRLWTTDYGPTTTDGRPPTTDGRLPTRDHAQSKSEIGASLVEILVAVAIIASALVIFIAALSTGSLGVRASNTLTTASNLAAVQLENIKNAAYDPAGYAPLPAPPGYSIAVDSTVIATNLQQVTVTVSLNGETLVVVSNYKVNR